MKKFLGVVIILILTGLIPATVLLYQIDNYILQPESLLTSLHNNDVYRELPQIVTQEYVTTEALTEMQLGMITQEQARSVLVQIFPPEWLEVNIVSNITQLFNLRYPDVEFQDISLLVSLSHPKNELVNAIKVVINESKQTVEQLPVCDANQENELSQAVKNETLSIESVIDTGCWPAELSRDELFAVSDIPFDPALLLSGIPDQINLMRIFISSMSTSPETTDLSLHNVKLYEKDYLPLKDIQQTLSRVQNIIYRVHSALPILLILILLAYIALFIALSSNTVTMLRWGTFGFLLPGIKLLAGGLLIKYLLPAILESNLLQQDLPDIFFGIILATATDYISHFSTIFIALGAIFIVLASVLLVLSIVKHKKKV